MKNDVREISYMFIPGSISYNHIKKFCVGEEGKLEDIYASDYDLYDLLLEGRLKSRGANSYEVSFTIDSNKSYSFSENNTPQQYQDEIIHEKDLNELPSPLAKYISRCGWRKMLRMFHTGESVNPAGC